MFHHGALSISLIYDPFESTPEGVQTQRRRVFLKQKPPTARPKMDGGRWGVGINAETRELLVAISSLIRCGRVKQALSIIDNELAGGC